jgi:hypothetical protein
VAFATVLEALAASAAVLPPQALNDAASRVAPVNIKSFKVFICRSPYIRRAQTHVVRRQARACNVCRND